MARARAFPRTARWVWLPLLLLGLTALAPPALAASAPLVAAHGARYHSVTNVWSSNWAGFAVTGAKNSVSDVKGSWIEPKIVGTCPLLGTSYSSFWVGIDGYSSRTVEQIGTDSDCLLGTANYYAWFEFYPNPSKVISSLTISSGDKIYAEVSAVGTKFTLTLKDTTAATSFSTSGGVTSAQRDSAEWIAEAPSSVSGVLPLADFGTAYFGSAHTGIKQTCTATISGVTGSIGSFANVQRITMVNLLGTATKAAPSALGSSGLGFSVTWKSAGP